MWLGRIAGSLVLGAILGGMAVYGAVPGPMTGSASCSGGACIPGAIDATWPWWYTGGGVDDSAAGAERGFGDRLNKALFAARAGEAAAQQGLLVRKNTMT